MTISKTYVIAMLVLCASSVDAQGPTRRDVMRVSGASVDSAFRAIALDPAEAAREFPGGAPDQYQVVVLRSQVAGTAEIHER